MRVVHLSTSDRGGAGIAAARLHVSLLKSGVDSHFLSLHTFGADLPQHNTYSRADLMSPAFLGNSLDYLEKVLKYAGIYRPPHERKSRYFLRGRAQGFEHFSFPDSNTSLHRHPLICSADIVHLHWVSDGMLPWKSFFSNVGKPLVWTLHDMNPFTGGCHHSDGCALFTGNCPLCPQLANTSDPGISSKILAYKLTSLIPVKNEGLSITAPSQWLLELSSKSTLFSRFAHYAIPNGIDTETFSAVPLPEARKALELPENKRILLFAAHHTTNPRKGIELLREALRRINREDLMVCSMGYAGNSGGTGSSERAFGYVSDPVKMRLLYSAADLFVLPSLAENFPNTILESLACGTPCVAFRTGGIPEQIHPGNGVLAESQDVESLVSGISLALATPFDRAEIARECREKYALPRIADRFSELYTSMR